MANEHSGPLNVKSNYKSDTPALIDAINKKLSTVDKGITGINKKKLEIQTNDKNLDRTISKLNELADINPNFKFDEIKSNATLSNLNELRTNVKDFYENEIPRLRNGLMELYSGDLIHPDQYEFFSEKLNELNNPKIMERSLGFLDNFKAKVESEITEAENFARDAMNNLNYNILGGVQGSTNIRNDWMELRDKIDNLNIKNVNDVDSFNDRMLQLTDYLDILNRVDTMTFARNDEELLSRSFDQGAFDTMRSSLESLGIDAEGLKNALKQAFQPQNIEGSSQAVQTLINNINQLKGALLDIKNILQSISGSGSNTSRLFEGLDKLSQLFNNITIGEEKIGNPIQTIIQQLSELQFSLDNVDSTKFNGSIGAMQQAFSTMSSNIAGGKSRKEMQAEANLLQAYEKIYGQLASSEIASYATMDATGLKEFNIDQFETKYEKIAAYEAQLNLVNERLKTKGKGVGVFNENNEVVADYTKTWRDFVDNANLLTGAKSSVTRSRNDFQNKLNKTMEQMTSGNILGDEFNGNGEGIDPSNFEGSIAQLNVIIEQLEYISQALGLINNNIVDGLNFENSESQIDALTTKIKDLEAELLKLQQESGNAINGGDTANPFASQVEGAERLVEAEEKVAEAAQKAKQVVSEGGTDTGSNSTANAAEAEAKAMQDAGEAARNAAEGKREFANANENAASTASATAGAAEAEASALKNVAEASRDTLDKRRTIYGADDNPAFMSEISSKKFANKYQTTTENYAWKADENGIEDWHKQSEIIVDDFKKIQTEQANAQKKVELARNKLKSWFQSVSNQTFGKANYIGEYKQMIADYGKDASGLTTVEDIEKVLNGMEKVQARVKEIQREMTKGNTSSLNPWQNASIAESSLSTSVDELERDAARLKAIPPEVSSAIKEIKEALGMFQGMSLDKGVPDKKMVDIDTYAKTFGDLALKIRETRTAIKDERIYEATNAVYDPYSELEGQIKRYGTISKRATRSEIAGKTSTEAYKADVAELEAVLTRIGQLEEQIRSRPFFDETKITSAAEKMRSIQKSLEDIRRQAELAGTKTSDMVKMSSDHFNENIKNYEIMTKGWLEDNGFKALDDNVIINFSNGIAKVSAQIKDAAGNWRKFSADIDATGNSLLNIKTPFANANEATRYSNSERMSNAAKFDMAAFQSQASNIASTFRDKLAKGGYQILGENPSVELLENGLVRVSAKIKDAQGNWHKFAETVDATGATISNATLKPITSNIESLERQLAGGKLSSDFTNQATASFEKFFNKIKEGSTGFNEISQRMEEFRLKASNVTDAESLAAYNSELTQLEESYKRLQILSRAAGKNSQMIVGTDGKPTQFGNIEEAVKSAKEYASTIGKIRSITGQIGMEQVPTGGIGQFTIQVKTAEGEVRNLKFAYDDFTNSMMSNAATKGFERTGLAGYLDRVQAKLQNLTAYWTAMVLNPYMIVGRVKEMVSTIVELDDALVDLRKTTTMSDADLNSFYFDANESAKELGVTTKEIISQAAEWSRLGYSDKESATQMAELSSQFASISPGMDTGSATEGLVSTMKAFDIETDNVKEGIMSKINAVGNAFAETNADVITGLEKSSSAMAAANNTMDETVALFTAGQEIVQNAQTVGSSLRTISMRIRGYDEETEELSEEYENLSGDIADLTKTEKNPGGVSLFTDSSKSEYKSTYEILKDISKIYDELSDKQQAQLLEKLFGKTRAQTGAAILSNFDQAEKAIKVMDESAGSADREMGIIQESLSFKINALKETWTGFLQGMIDKGALGSVLDVFTSISNGATSLISIFGELESILSAIISLSISRFTGKNFFSFDKETGKMLFQNPFKKENPDSGLDNLSPSAKKLEGTRIAAKEVEATIDELNSREITLGSNAPALENLEQVEVKAQETAAAVNEAMASTQSAQNTAVTQTPLVVDAETDNIVEQVDTSLAENGAEVVVTPIVDEAALRDVSDDISDVEQGKVVAATEDTAAVEANTAANMQNAASQEVVGASAQQASAGLQAATVSAETDAVASEAGAAANMQNAASQEAVGAAAQNAAAGLEAATLAADTEAAAMEKMAVSTQTSGSALANLQPLTREGIFTGISNMADGVATSLSNAGDAIINFAGSMASMLGNFLIVMVAIKGFELAMKGLNYVIHYNENMIKAGEEAVESITEAYDNYNSKIESIKSASSALADDDTNINSTADSITNLTNKYTELSKGVDTLSNKNLSLNDEDYQSFLDTSNQIADVLPSLAQGYDSNGNAILNLGNNAAEASEKLKEALENQQQLSHYDISKSLDSQVQGVFARDREYGTSNNKNKMEISELNKQISHIKNTPLDELMFDSENERKNYLDELYKDLKFYKGQQKVLSQKMQENWKSILPSIQELLKTDTGFTDLNQEVQDKIIGAIGGLDGKKIQNMLEKHGGSEIELESYFRETYIEPFEKIEKEGLTDRLLGLFELDNSKKTFKEYTETINNELNKIFGGNKAQISTWKNILGIDDLNEQQEKVHHILQDTTDSLEVTVSQFDSLTMDEREIAYDLIVNDKFEGTFDELKKRIAESKENILDLNATPLLDKYNQAVKDAEENGNQGKSYDEYGAALKSLKEQYDKGLIGTETFKKGAKMFSIGGATDADNFIENYERMSKFWNEENPIEGVTAFAEEMEKLDLMGKNDDGAFVTKFENVEEAAKKAKMPLELFVSMFNKMEEFGGFNDLFASADDGYQTIGEITGELAAAKAELEKLEDVKPKNKNKSAIEAKKKEVEELQERLKSAKEELIEFLNNGGLKKYAENYKDQRSAAKEGLRELNNSKAFKEADNDQKNIMLEAIRSGFENSGLDESIYKNLGFDKNGKIVLDVQSRNDRIDKILEAYNSEETRGKKFGDKTAEEIVKGWADDLGLSVKDYINKMNNGELEPPASTNESEMDKNIQAVVGATVAAENVTAALNALTYAITGKDPGQDGKNVNGNKKETPESITDKGLVDAGKKEVFEKGTNTADELAHGGLPQPTNYQTPLNKADEYDNRINEEEINRKGASAAGKFIDGFVDFLTGGNVEVNAAEVPDDYVRQTPNEDFNFTNRPKVGWEDMRANGWNVEEGSYSTVKPTSYADENGKEYLITPILPNGDVLDPEGFQQYVDGIIDGAPDDKGLVISTFEGKGAAKAATDYSQALHKVHEAYYSTNQAAQTAIESLKGYSEEELRSIDLTDDSTSEMENQFVSLMDSMDLSSDQAEQFINVLRDMGLIKVQPQVDVSGLNLDKVKSVEELNSKLSGKLEVGQSVTYTADVEGVKKEVEAVEDQEGHITYYAENLKGVKEEVKPVANQKGEITYEVKTKGDKKTDKKSKKDGGTITTKTDMDTKAFDQKTNEVESKMRKVDGKRANPHVSLSGAGTVGAQLSSISSKISGLNGRKATVTLTTIKEIITKHTPKKNGTFHVGHAEGTFSAANAYAKGTTSSNNVAIEKDETALINELGNEIVVRNGKAMTFNNGYPVFANLKKGDIVFNHKQTKELEKKGYITGSHAKMYGAPAFAEGTVDDEDEEEILLANAYYTGKAGFNPKSTTKKSSSSPTSKGSGSKGSGSKGSGSKGHSGSSSSSEKDLDKIWKKFTDKVSKLFDWIEIKLSRLKDKTEKWTTAAEKAVNPGSGTQAKFYNNAINSLSKELINNQKATTKYENKAESIGRSGIKTYNKYVEKYNSKKKNKKKKKKKLSNKWLKNTFNKVKNGYFLEKDTGKIKKGAIANYNEKQQEIIKDMQAWYDKSYQSQKAVRDLTDSMQELYTKLRDIPNVKADKAIEKITKTLEHLKSVGGLLSKTTVSNNYIDSVLSNLDEQTAQAYEERDKRIAAEKTTKNNLSKDTNSLRNILSLKPKSKKGKKIFKGSTAEQRKNIKTAIGKGNKIEINDKWSADLKKAVAAYNASLDSYQTATNNAQTATDKALETFYQNAAEKLSAIEEYWSGMSERFVSEQNVYSSYVELGKANGQRYDSTYKIFDAQAKAIDKEVETAKSKYNEYLAEVQSQLDAGEITYDTPDYWKAISNLESMQSAIYEASKKAVDFQKSLRELDFSNLEKQLKRIQNTINRLGNKASYAETIGNKRGALYDIDESLYQGIITEDINAINKAYEQLQFALDEQKKYSIDSDEWWDWNEKATQAQSTIHSLGLDIEEMSDKIRELRWKPFNDFMETLKRTETELSGIIGLLKKDNYIGLDAGLTKDSITALALYNELIQNSNQKIEGWREALEAIDKEVKNGNISMDERNKLESEYIDNILSEANNVAEYRNEILEIYYAQLEREHELLEENVNLRVEALDKMKSYYDYQKSISNQSRDIAYLEQQARALQGVNNKSGKSRLASIQNELQSKKQDLNDTKFNHELDLRREGYDRLVEDSKEAYDRIVDNTKRSTEEQDKIVSEYCDKAVANYTTAYTTINNIIDKNGLVFSKNTKDIITKIGNIGTDLDALAKSYGTNTEAIVKLIKSQASEVSTLAANYKTVNTNASTFFGTILSSGQIFSDAQKSVKNYIDELNKIPKVDVSDIEKVNTDGDEGFARNENEESARDKIDKSYNTETGEVGNNAEKDKNGDITDKNDQDKDYGKNSVPEIKTPTTTSKKPETTSAKPAVTTTAKLTNSDWLKIYKANHNGLDMYNIASNFISKKATKLNKEKYKDLSTANKKIYNYVKGDWAIFKGSGGSLSTADMKTLASKLGIPWDDEHPMKDANSKLNLVLKWIGFAKGSKYVPKDQLAWTQEKGQEVIYRRSDGAMLTPLGQGDKVFTAEMTDNLWKIAKGISVDSIGQDLVDRSKIINIKPVIDMSGMDNSIIVQGNANQDTVNQIRSIMDNRFNQFTKELTEDFGMFGHKIKF